MIIHKKRSLSLVNKIINNGQYNLTLLVKITNIIKFTNEYIQFTILFYECDKNTKRLF